MASPAWQEWHNWLLVLKEDGLFVNHSEPSGSTDVSESVATAKGYGSEGGKGRRDMKHLNKYKVERLVKVTAIHCDGVGKDSYWTIELEDGTKRILHWSTHYVNASYPHHKSIDAVHEIVSKASKLGYIRKS